MENGKSIMGEYIEKYNIHNMTDENIKNAIEEYNELELEYNSLNYALRNDDFFNYQQDVYPMMYAMQVAYTKTSYLMSLFNELGINPLDYNCKRK